MFSLPSRDAFPHLIASRGIERERERGTALSGKNCRYRALKNLVESNFRSSRLLRRSGGRARTSFSPHFTLCCPLARVGRNLRLPSKLFELPSRPADLRACNISRSVGVKLDAEGGFWFLRILISAREGKDRISTFSYGWMRKVRFNLYASE